MQLLGDIFHRSLLGKSMLNKICIGWWAPDRALCFRLAKQTLKQEARSYRERDVNATRFFVYTMFCL